ADWDDEYYDELDDFEEPADGDSQEEGTRSPAMTTVDVVGTQGEPLDPEVSEKMTAQQQASDRRKKARSKSIAEMVADLGSFGRGGSKADRADKENEVDEPETAPASPSPSVSPAMPITRVLPQTGADRLLTELQDSSAAVRRRAIWNLGQWGDSRAIAPLMELMVSADSQQRSIILAVLSEIGTRTLRPMERAMAISLQDSDPEVRVNAIRDLTQVYDRFAQVSRMLAYAAEDKDETVQRTAKWALGKLEALRGAAETSGDEIGAGGGAGISLGGSGDTDGMVLLAQARQAYDAKNYDQAAAMVKEAIAQEPSHPQVHLLAAEVAIAQEQPVKAVVSEQRARDCAWDRGDGATATVIQEGWLSRELDPDRAALCHAQGIQALRANQVDDALGLLDEALVCNPYDPEIYMARARVLRQQGKLGESCAHWQKAQEIYLELGNVKALKGVQQLLQKFG
ncbi:MAG: HEAT repeat domain-containing protein, partial [Cyanobacteria bacterium P01_H01_bin.130]